jgi:hypothetical protein
MLLNTLLDEGAFHELTPFVDPAAVPGADLVLISGTYVGLEHYGWVGGLDQLFGGVLCAPQGGAGQFRAEHSGTCLMLLHRANEVLHALPMLPPHFFASVATATISS